MNTHANIQGASTSSLLVKVNSAVPAIFVAEGGIGVRAGTQFCGRAFDGSEVVPFPEDIRVPGSDYAVTAMDDGTLSIVRLTSSTISDSVLGGFHFAPGGNATARKGGDEIPSINPCSLWDVKFRPACADPRGMALIEGAGRRFWCDMYLLGVNHLTDGTSRFGAVIADGNDCPIDPATGEAFEQLDYPTAVAVMAHHGKQLLSIEESFAALIGVTEKTSHSGDPKITKLDALRTSRAGIMQATGNLWIWGHDGDPDEPRASLFGGSWWYDDYAGSRCAGVGDWPDNSLEGFGARGRSDHLIHVEPSRQRRRRSR